MMLRTSAQRKELCKDCPVARVADLVGDSCSILIMRDLLEGPRRFCELESSLSGVSSRTLTNKLKYLEDRGLVARKAARSVSQYALTKKGAALKDVVESMRRYGKKYL